MCKPLRCALFLAALGWAPSRVLAIDVEQREYAIFVDGKEAGQSRMTITVQDDGTTVMQGSVNVKVPKVVFTYELNVEATEWWKEGRLVGMKVNSTENKKKTEIHASPDGQNLKVRTNGKERQVRGDVWTSSYWKLADGRFHNKAVPLLDPESGKDFTGQLQYVATEKLKINDQLQEVYRFRVTNVPSPIELWFDRYHRLVRQEFTESGHKAIVQLVNVRR